MPGPESDLSKCSGSYVVPKRCGMPKDHDGECGPGPEVTGDVVAGRYLVITEVDGPMSLSKAGKFVWEALQADGRFTRVAVKRIQPATKIG